MDGSDCLHPGSLFISDSFFIIGPFFIVYVYENSKKKSEHIGHVPASAPISPAISSDGAKIPLSDYFG